MTYDELLALRAKLLRKASVGKVLTQASIFVYSDGKWHASTCDASPDLTWLRANDK